MNRHTANPLVIFAVPPTRHGAASPHWAAEHSDTGLGSGVWPRLFRTEKGGKISQWRTRKAVHDHEGGLIAVEYECGRFTLTLHNDD